MSHFPKSSACIRKVTFAVVPFFSLSLYCGSCITTGVPFAWSQKNKMVSLEAQSKLQWEEREGSTEVGSGESLLPA